MVRHGSLSKGCQTCRKRKIKCDQGRPACSKCIKAGWTCPQYSDSVERMFQYQYIPDFNNSADQEKIKISRRVSSGDLSLPHYLPHISPPKEILQPINDLAVDFFLSTHVFRDSGPVRGHFEYLFAFRNDPGMDETLSTTLCAVSLAAYASAFRYPDLLNRARSLFGSAIHLVNTALSSRGEATKDSTVSCIILLNTFAALTYKDQQSLSDCHKHMSGVLTIIKLRGYSHLESRHGLQLFLHFSFVLLQGSIYHSIRTPEELIKLREYAETFLDKDDPAWRLSNIIVRFASFRADVKDRILRDHVRIVEAAMKLDSEFSSLGEHMPPSWQFETFFMSKKSELLCETYFHVYPDLWVAHIWNDLRTCRLLLQEEICNQFKDARASFLQPLFSTDVMSYELSNKILQQMILDICATVPQYSGHLSTLLPFALRSEASKLPEDVPFSSIPVSSDIPTTAGVYFLLWPLLNAGRLAESDTQLDWIIQSCRTLGRNTGIGQAFMLANILEAGEKISVSSTEMRFKARSKARDLNSS